LNRDPGLELEVEFEESELLGVSGVPEVETD
jgi:hypothetical protein